MSQTWAPSGVEVADKIPVGRRDRLSGSSRYPRTKMPITKVRTIIKTRKARVSRFLFLARSILARISYRREISQTVLVEVIGPWGFFRGDGLNRRGR